MFLSIFMNKKMQCPRYNKLMNVPAEPRNLRRLGSTLSPSFRVTKRQVANRDTAIADRQELAIRQFFLVQSFSYAP
jgi:hypothetical protein